MFSLSKSYGRDNGQFWLTVAYSRIEAEGHRNCHPPLIFKVGFCCCICGEVWRGAAPSNGEANEVRKSAP
jgi:hypothetical protein